MHIRFITTGGTIDKIYFDALSQFEVGESLVQHILTDGLVDLEYDVVSLFQKDSLEISDTDRKVLLDRDARILDEHIVLVAVSEVLLRCDGAAHDHGASDFGDAMGGDDQLLRTLRTRRAVLQVNPVPPQDSRVRLDHLSPHRDSLPREARLALEDLSDSVAPLDPLDARDVERHLKLGLAALVVRWARGAGLPA